MIQDLKDRNRARTGHFIAHWGVPKDIQVRPYVGGIELAVVVFGPKEDRKSWRYATNGMSEFVQESDQGRLRTELYACTHKMGDWVVALLHALASYPLQKRTFFADYDTVPVSQPIDRKESPYRGVLLAPTSPEDPENLGEIDGVTEEPIFVHLVVPIYDVECELAIDKGGQELWARLLSSGSSLCLDGQRSSVI